MSLYLGNDLISGKTTVVGESRNVGQIIPSTIPLTDAGLHLLDGALISGSGIYSDFVDYIATLSSSNPECFDTEANWQAAVTANGVCGKFVYDSVNNTVRLPKYNSKIYTGGGTTQVKGNGMTLGLTDGTNNYGFQIGSDTYNYAIVAAGNYGQSAGTAKTTAPTINLSLGITADGSKSGIIADLANITTSLNGYYYIVVATTTKTEVQVDIDEIAADLNGKADVDLTNVSNTSGFRKLVEIYNNGTDWYKVYNEYNPSTGVYIGQWCEQGGETTNVTSVSFLKLFTNANWSFTTGTVSTSSNSYGYNYIKNKTASGFDWSAKNASITQIWRAEGYLAAT